MTQPPSQEPNYGQVANKTVIVILTLVGLCCVLPCLGWAVLGGLAQIMPDY